MIIDGIFLGVMSWLSMFITFRKIPDSVKHYLFKYELLTDIVAGISIWLFLTSISKTATAVIGATIAEILIAFTLSTAKASYEKQL